jgi:pyruvate dehydrogenase E2 component (dihydrolipoamide acetyltransferase)
VADFKLPELGENVATGDVLRVLVKPGDTIVRDQPVLELETDKATIEVPSSVAGRVTSVNVKAGDKVKVGQLVLAVDAEEPAPAPPGPARGPDQPAPRATAADRPAAAAKGARGAEREERQIAPAEAVPPRAPNVVDISRGARATADAESSGEFPPAPASPSVRRIARELGVDVNDVPGTGPDGRIAEDDVMAYARRLITGGSHAGSNIAAEPLPDFSRWGEIERQPMRAVRRKTAAHLSAAWMTVPHVTQHELADITDLEAWRKRYSSQVEAAGGALTVTAVVTKVVAHALKIFPQFNASVDLEHEELILKKYVHIGIAVDTDRGLLVPVVRNADTKNIIQLAVEITQLSAKARSRKISLEEMQGGCFSISNLGGIGGTYFTPIVHAPEVAILGISRGRIQPVYEDGQFVPRQMLPLSLSYDHRVIDGADGMRFLRWIVDAIEQPFLLALQG